MKPLQTLSVSTSDCEYLLESEDFNSIFILENSNKIHLLIKVIILISFSVASTEDSPIANKLKRIWFKTPIGEEQATQAVLDPVVGEYYL